MANILITGCSSGIGLETAKLLKEKGYKVYATARKKEDVLMLQDLDFIAYKLDITNEIEIAEVLEKILKLDKTLDAVFNNAGFGQPGAVEDITTKVLKEQFETNFFGTHEMTYQVMKIFREQGYGKIIQHSSVLGLISLKFRGAYNASKYAIEGLNDTLRQELLNHEKIFISTINTGPVTSKFRENALKKFNQNINTKDSYFRNIYAQELKARLENNKDTTPFNLPASSVAKVVLKIMKAKKPKPRYYVTIATYLLGFAKRILSTSLLDKLLNKI